jgi:hypothetical protein
MRTSSKGRRNPDRPRNEHQANAEFVVRQDRGLLHSPLANSENVGSTQQ